MATSLLYTLLVALHMGSYSVEASPAPVVDGEVLFSSSNFIRQMPAPCARQSYCFEKGLKYPKDKVQKLVSKYIVENVEPSTDLGFYNGDSSDCPSNSTEGPIYYITDNNKKVRVVVQTSEFKQIYSVKWCLKEGPITEATTHLSKDTVNSFKLECVTSTMDVNFLVLSEFEDKLEIFKAGGIPVCCKCRYLQ